MASRPWEEASADTLVGTSGLYKHNNTGHVDHMDHMDKTTKILSGPTGWPLKFSGHFSGTLHLLSKDKWVTETVYIIQSSDQPAGSSCNYTTQPQWRSQNTADARAQHGHATFASSLKPRPRPALSCLQYGMQKQPGWFGWYSPRKFWNFWTSYRISSRGRNIYYPVPYLQHHSNLKSSKNPKQMTYSCKSHFNTVNPVGCALNISIFPYWKFKIPSQYGQQHEEATDDIQAP